MSIEFPISIINEQYLFIVPIIHCENNFYYVSEIWLIDSNYNIIINKYLFGEFHNRSVLIIINWS